MNRSLFPILTLLIGLLALPALADTQQPPNQQLVRSVERELPNYVSGVDVRTLSTGQLSALHVVLYSNRSHSAIQGEIRSILGGIDVLLFGVNLSRL